MGRVGPREPAVRRGLTLIEALITLFLTALAVGLIGGLLRSYAVILHEEDPHQELLQVVRLASVRLTSAVHSAIEIVEADTALVLRVPVTQLPTPLPVPLPDSWDPLADLREVRFDARGGNLRQDGEVLLSGVEEFRCQQPSPRLVEVKLTVQERRQKTVITVRAEAPLL